MKEFQRDITFSCRDTIPAYQCVTATPDTQQHCLRCAYC